MANLKVTLKRSLIGRPQKQHNIIKTLGLTKKLIQLMLFRTQKLHVTQSNALSI
jgi:Ribosomal protein L30p/L7e.